MITKIRNWTKLFCLIFFFFFLKDVKFPLMLDVYELCTTELQEKMLPIRSKFKNMEDKKLEKQQQKVRLIYNIVLMSYNLVAEKFPCYNNVHHIFLFCFLH